MKMHYIELLTIISMSMFMQFAHAQKGDAVAKALFYDPASRISDNTVDSGQIEIATNELKKNEKKESEQSGDKPTVMAGPEEIASGEVMTGLMHWIELLPADGAYPLRVSSDRIYKSGEKIRIHLMANNNGRIFVFHTGSSGDVKVFPAAMGAGEPGLVEQGKDVVIPADESEILLFDTQPGTEKLQLIFTPDNTKNKQVNQNIDSASSDSGDLAVLLLELINKQNSLEPPIVYTASGAKDLVIADIADACIKRSKEQSCDQNSSDIEEAPASYQVSPQGESVVVNINLTHK